MNGYLVRQDSPSKPCHLSGFPLHVALLPSNAGPYCQAFLLQLKALGYQPKVVITGGGLLRPPLVSGYPIHQP